MADNKKQKHFVLVHGLCHGAWCRYRLKPQLESAGHRITVLDLAASGNTRGAQLWRHEFGSSHGFVPAQDFSWCFRNSFHARYYTPTVICHGQGSEDTLQTDLETVTIGSPEQPRTITNMGPKYLASHLYQLSPVEVVSLSFFLCWPGSVFQQELSKAKNFSDEGYGSVTRVFVVCGEDKTLKLKFQRWMIQNNPPKDVVEIKGADHMAMFSKTKQLCHGLSLRDCK
ncbi:hypothetical protein CRYUN_Cryun22dG0102100 [Craigia yunnanensis]